MYQNLFICFNTNKNIRNKFAKILKYVKTVFVLHNTSVYATILEIVFSVYF